MSLRVGVISAMARELRPLLNGWKRTTLRDGSRVYGVWCDREVTYIASGIGRTPATLATRALVWSERPDIVISVGFAGALTPHLAVGETICAGKVIDAGSGEEYPTQGGESVLVTSRLIADEFAKKDLAQKYGADAVDMEASAVAGVARENGIPFLAVKVISDELNFPMLPFQPYVTNDGRLAIERFAAHVAIRPAYWSSLMQMARNSKKASWELSAAMEYLLDRLSSSTKGNLPQVLRELVFSARPVN
jgi:adenosylhomocysteine nucleosidase